MNKYYYIDIDSLHNTLAKKDTITVYYNNGLNKIQREYKIGQDIPTVITID